MKSDGGSTDYYVLPEGARDILDLIDYRGMSFGVGNIFKATYRLGQKDGVDQTYDLRKIVFFAERELEKIEAETSDIELMEEKLRALEIKVARLKQAIYESKRRTYISAPVMIEEQ